MDRVLELLATVTPETSKLAVELVVPDLLATSTAQQKHKLKTRISALLKSSGPSRAVGAVLARRTLVDWSIVKSHGATWAPILLHVLDLPDRVGWAPAVRTLTFLFTQVHGKADLSREIAGARIGEFMKRLLKILPDSRANLFASVARMLQLYPTQCRPYLNKLAPLLNAPGGEQALASLCLAEKNGADVWRQSVNDVLSHLENGNSSNSSTFSELDQAHQLAMLREYIAVAGDVKAKVPAQRLLKVLSAGLQSYKPRTALLIVNFMLDTRVYLETLFIQSFDTLLYTLVECVNLGTSVALRVAEFLAWQLISVGWISENYTQVLTRLTKKLLVLASRRNEPIAADGLADYVQNPTGFKRSDFYAEDTASLSHYFSAVLLNVPGIPQSVRTQIDYHLLAHGTAAEIAKATLYPGRFSILPLSINRLPKLDALEALVHPRFPPLNISQHALQLAESEAQRDAAQATGNQDVFEPVVSGEAINGTEESSPAITGPAQAGGSPQDTVEAEVEVEAEADISRPLPAIPESNKPVHHSELDIVRPEKRLKLSDSEPESQEGTLPTSINVNEGNGEDDDDDDEELVIPTLTMDSD